MSIGSIGAYSNWWQSQNQAATGSSAATATSSSSNNITNSGSLAATSNMSTFMQAFSADLQSMLTQLGNATSASATSSTTSASSASSSIDQTGTTQAQGAEHHHHHHHAGGAGEDGSPQNTANQLVGEIGQSLQGGTLTAGQINQSASVLAGDVMQALQSYGQSYQRFRLVHHSLKRGAGAGYRRQNGWIKKILKQPLITGRYPASPANDCNGAADMSGVISGMNYSLLFQSQTSSDIDTAILNTLTAPHPRRHRLPLSFRPATR